MKINGVVLCITSSNYCGVKMNLTVGKEYRILKKASKLIVIEDDNKDKFGYPMVWFSISERRKNIINSL